jgi:hypothetical protein
LNCHDEVTLHSKDNDKHVYHAYSMYGSMIPRGSRTCQCHGVSHVSHVSPHIDAKTKTALPISHSSSPHNPSRTSRDASATSGSTSRHPMTRQHRQPLSSIVRLHCFVRPRWTGQKLVLLAYSIHQRAKHRQVPCIVLQDSRYIAVSYGPLVIPSLLSSFITSLLYH